MDDYDRIGHGYAATRREDPRLAARIRAALGDARTVVNVGAGAGSYEPSDRWVLAIEPSDVMAAQRAPDRAPALRLWAGPLPLRDRCVDASMAVLTLHHWGAAQASGVREMRRIARGAVVIVTIDPEVSSRMWLMADYFHEVAAWDRSVFPPIADVVDWLGGDASTEVVPVPRDTTDWTLLSFWAHPERVLDPAARAATSGFAKAAPEVTRRVVADVRRDLEDGTWERRNGHLRALDAFDAGLRLVVAPRAPGA